MLKNKHFYKLLRYSECEPKNTSMDIKKKAHEGKIVTVKDNKFFLLKERVRGGCKGCDLINTLGCTKEITDLCRQGFIFKKLKK